MSDIDWRKPVCGWCDAELPSREEQRKHAMFCEKSPLVASLQNYDCAYGTTEANPQHVCTWGGGPPCLAKKLDEAIDLIVEEREDSNSMGRALADLNESLLRMEGVLKELRLDCVCGCGEAWTSRNLHAPECRAYMLPDIDAALEGRK